MPRLPRHFCKHRKKERCGEFLCNTLYLERGVVGGLGNYQQIVFKNRSIKVRIKFIAHPYLSRETFVSNTSTRFSRENIKFSISFILWFLPY
jgi:hypothetical protein